MNLNECSTTYERDVVLTYRRHLKRKGATPFSAQGSALAEEIGGGAILSWDFVNNFTEGTRELTPDGRITLTRAGREYIEVAAGISADKDEWHVWSPLGDYVRSGCGLVRDGLRQPKDKPPTGARMCSVCESVSTVETDTIESRIERNLS